ncbi:response regulator [Dyadobacter pollutisoli]|uniref:Response regulator n=1 Tax=Dyadobacter pollutisoli TaxID=2910158 RepID=A0A9E8NG88_9BACT|nr:response regulator [Dyadobacter pollutisoli]WAC13707.1 response regulator [Dyadobacter pollutisoli]
MTIKKIRILILEDEGIQAMGLEETLEKHGYEVALIADNGKEALEFISHEPVDLALLDIHIKGDMDGIETAWKMKDVTSIPIIYLTAYMDNETVRRAEETAPAAYLTKPYRELNLINSIEIALQNANK